ILYRAQSRGHPTPALAAVGGTDVLDSTSDPYRCGSLSFAPPAAGTRGVYTPRAHINRKHRRVAETSSRWPPRTCRRVVTSLRPDCSPQGGYVMSNTEPIPATILTPEAVIAQMRTVRSQIEEVAPLSQEQRKLLKQRLRNHTPD